jgi:anti-sigma B factor antagonist
MLRSPVSRTVDGEPRCEGVIVELSLSKSAAESQVILAVRGDVDVHSAPRLHDELAEIIDAGNVSVIVDLTGIAFIDSTGLGALVAAQDRVPDSVGILKLVCVAERILKLFRITGLDQVFSIHRSVSEAMASAR